MPESKSWAPGATRLCKSTAMNLNYPRSISSSKRLAITTCCIFSKLSHTFCFSRWSISLELVKGFLQQRCFYRSWNYKSSHNATWYIAVSSCLEFTFTIEAFDFLGHFCPFFPCRCFGNFMLLIQTCFAILSIILEKTSRQGGIRKNIIVLKCKNKVYLCWSPIFFCRIFERTVLGMMKQDWSLYIWLCKFI